MDNNLKKLNMMKSRLSIPLFAVILLTLASCGQKAPEVEKVQVQAITLKDTTCVIEYVYPATLQGLRDVAIYPQVSGRITAIRVIEGQFVNKGDVLFEIDDVPYRAAYDAALAEVDVAKAELQNAQYTFESKQNLFDREIISKYQLNLARNQVTTAEAMLEQANASLKDAANNLSFTKVRTMGKGYIGSLPYKVGSLVGPNISAPLTIVSDNSEVYADFSIPERTYLEIFGSKEADTDSMDLSLITGLGQEYGHKGKIHSMSGLISNETGALPIRALFPNPERLLLSGGSCQIIYRTSADNMITVPRSAMKELQDKLFVFVIRDGKLEQTAVSAMRYNAAEWVILPDADGSYPLQPGDQITSTTNRLKDGDEVEIVSR